MGTFQKGLRQAPGDMALRPSAFLQQRPSLSTGKLRLVFRLCALVQKQTESKTAAYMCGCMHTKMSVENRTGGFDNLKSRQALTSRMLSCLSTSSTRDSLNDVQMAHQCGGARKDKALNLTQPVSMKNGHYPNLPRSARIVCAVSTAGCISS